MADQIQSTPQIYPGLIKYLLKKNSYSKELDGKVDENGDGKPEAPDGKTSKKEWEYYFGSIERYPRTTIKVIELADLDHEQPADAKNELANYYLSLFKKQLRSDFVSEKDISWDLQRLVRDPDLEQRTKEDIVAGMAALYDPDNFEKGNKVLSPLASIAIMEDVDLSVKKNAINALCDYLFISKDPKAISKISEGLRGAASTNQNVKELKEWMADKLLMLLKPDMNASASKAICASLSAIGIDQHVSAPIREKIIDGLFSLIAVSVSNGNIEAAVIALKDLAVNSDLPLKTRNEVIDGLLRASSGGREAAKESIVRSFGHIAADNEIDSSIRLKMITRLFQILDQGSSDNIAFACADALARTAGRGKLDPRIADLLKSKLIAYIENGKPLAAMRGMASALLGLKNRYYDFGITSFGSTFNSGISGDIEGRTGAFLDSGRLENAGIRDIGFLMILIEDMGTGLEDREAAALKILGIYDSNVSELVKKDIIMSLSKAASFPISPGIKEKIAPKVIEIIRSADSRISLLTDSLENIVKDPFVSGRTKEYIIEELFKLIGSENDIYIFSALGQIIRSNNLESQIREQTADRLISLLETEKDETRSGYAQGVVAELIVSADVPKSMKERTYGVLLRYIKSGGRNPAVSGTFYKIMVASEATDIDMASDMARIVDEFMEILNSDLSDENKAPIAKLMISFMLDSSSYYKIAVKNQRRIIGKILAIISGNREKKTMAAIISSLSERSYSFSKIDDRLRKETTARLKAVIASGRPSEHMKDIRKICADMRGTAKLEKEDAKKAVVGLFQALRTARTESEAKNITNEIYAIGCGYDVDLMLKEFTAPLLMQALESGKPSSALPDIADHLAKVLSADKFYAKIKESIYPRLIALVGSKTYENIFPKIAEALQAIAADRGVKDEICESIFREMVKIVRSERSDIAKLPAIKAISGSVSSWNISDGPKADIAQYMLAFVLKEHDPEVLKGTYGLFLPLFKNDRLDKELRISILLQLVAGLNEGGSKDIVDRIAYGLSDTDISFIKDMSVYNRVVNGLLDFIKSDKSSNARSEIIAWCSKIAVAENISKITNVLAELVKTGEPKEVYESAAWALSNIARSKLTDEAMRSIIKVIFDCLKYDRSARTTENLININTIDIMSSYKTKPGIMKELLRCLITLIASSNNDELLNRIGSSFSYVAGGSYDSDPKPAEELAAVLIDVFDPDKATGSQKVIADLLCAIADNSHVDLKIKEKIYAKLLISLDKASSEQDIQRTISTLSSAVNNDKTAPDMKLMIVNAMFRSLRSCASSFFRLAVSDALAGFMTAYSLDEKIRGLVRVKILAMLAAGQPKDVIPSVLCALSVMSSNDSFDKKLAEELAPKMLALLESNRYQYSAGYISRILENLSSTKHMSAEKLETLVPRLISIISAGKPRGAMGSVSAVLASIATAAEISEGSKENIVRTLLNIIVSGKPGHVLDKASGALIAASQGAAVPLRIKSMIAEALPQLLTRYTKGKIAENISAILRNVADDPELDPKIKTEIVPVLLQLLGSDSLLKENGADEAGKSPKLFNPFKEDSDENDYFSNILTSLSAMIVDPKIDPEVKTLSVKTYFAIIEKKPASKITGSICRALSSLVSASDERVPSDTKAYIVNRLIFLTSKDEYRNILQEATDALTAIATGQSASAGVRKHIATSMFGQAVRKNTTEEKGVMFTSLATISGSPSVPLEVRKIISKEVRKYPIKAESDKVQRSLLNILSNVTDDKRTDKDEKKANIECLLALLEADRGQGAAEEVLSCLSTIVSGGYVSYGEARIDYIPVSMKEIIAGRIMDLYRKGKLNKEASSARSVLSQIAADPRVDRHIRLNIAKILISYIELGISDPSYDYESSTALESLNAIVERSGSPYLIGNIVLMLIPLLNEKMGDGRTEKILKIFSTAVSGKKLDAGIELEILPILEKYFRSSEREEARSNAIIALESVAADARIDPAVREKIIIEMLSSGEGNLSDEISSELQNMVLALSKDPRTKINERLLRCMTLAFSAGSSYSDDEVQTKLVNRFIELASGKNADPIARKTLKEKMIGIIETGKPPAAVLPSIRALRAMSDPDEIIMRLFPILLKSDELFGTRSSSDPFLIQDSSDDDNDSVPKEFMSILQECSADTKEKVVDKLLSYLDGGIEGSEAEKLSFIFSDLARESIISGPLRKKVALKVFSAIESGKPAEAVTPLTGVLLRYDGIDAGTDKDIAAKTLAIINSEPSKAMSDKALGNLARYVGLQVIDAKIETKDRSYFADQLISLLSRSLTARTLSAALEGLTVVLMDPDSPVEMKSDIISKWFDFLSKTGNAELIEASSNYLGGLCNNSYYEEGSYENRSADAVSKGLLLLPLIELLGSRKLLNTKDAVINNISGAILGIINGYSIDAKKLDGSIAPLFNIFAAGKPGRAMGNIAAAIAGLMRNSEISPERKEYAAPILLKLLSSNAHKETAGKISEAISNIVIDPKVSAPIRDKLAPKIMDAFESHIGYSYLSQALSYIVLDEKVSFGTKESITNRLLDIYGLNYSKEGGANSLAVLSDISAGTTVQPEIKERIGSRLLNMYSSKANNRFDILNVLANIASDPKVGPKIKSEIIQLLFKVVETEELEGRSEVITRTFSNIVSDPNIYPETRDKILAYYSNILETSNEREKLNIVSQAFVALFVSKNYPADAKMQKADYLVNILKTSDNNVALNNTVFMLSSIVIANVPAEIRTKITGILFDVLEKPSDFTFSSSKISSDAKDMIREAAGYALANSMKDYNRDQVERDDIANRLLLIINRNEYDELSKFLLSILKPASEALTPAVAEKVNVLIQKTLPATPPYDSWFRDKNKLTVKVYFQEKAKFDIWRNMYMNSKHGYLSVQKKDDKGNVTETIFSKTVPGGIKVKIIVPEPAGTKDEFRAEVFENMADPGIDWIVYNGHSGEGAELYLSLSRAPQFSDVILKNPKLIQCASCTSVPSYYGKVKSLFPNCQFVGTTGEGFSGDGCTVFAGVLEGILEKKTWEQIKADLDNEDKKLVKGKKYVNPGNYLLPDQAEQLGYLDSDGDGEYDKVDPVYNLGENSNVISIDTFDFQPNPSIPSSKKLSMAMIDIFHVSFSYDPFLSRFKNIYQLDAVEGMKKGWFRDDDPLHFMKADVSYEGEDGIALKLSVNVGYSFSSLTALRALLIYELNHYLSENFEIIDGKRQKKYELTKMTPEEKLRGFLYAVEVLEKEYIKAGVTEECKKTMEMLYKQFVGIKKYDIPQGIEFSLVLDALKADDGTPTPTAKESMKKLRTYFIK